MLSNWYRNNPGDEETLPTVYKVIGWSGPLRLVQVFRDGFKPTVQEKDPSDLEELTEIDEKEAQSILSAQHL